MNPSRAILAPLASALLWTAASPAQTTEYHLDASGKWVAADPAQSPAPDSDAGLIAQARRDIAAERFDQALSSLNDWISAHEKSTNPFLSQAYLLRGDALTATGEEFKALYDYEAICLQFSGTPEFEKAVERELDIGIRYLNGLRRRVFWVRIMSCEDLAEELLIRVQERFPGSRMAERAGIELADYYFRNDDMEMAAEAYKIFIRLYPKSAYCQKAMERQAYATIAHYKGPRYDGTPLIDAGVLARRFAALYPAAAQNAGLDDALQARLDDQAAAAMLENARWYLDRNDPVSARYTLQSLIDKHPRSAAASSAIRIQTERGWFGPKPRPGGNNAPTPAPRPRLSPGTPISTSPSNPSPAAGGAQSNPPSPPMQPSQQTPGAAP